MKQYLNYLLNEMIPGLFKGSVRFITETLRVIKQYALWIILILVFLYFTDIWGMQGSINSFFHSFKHLSH
ncbi:MAG: hypothetical protein ACI4TE_04175 [Alphaproteobacteria bacterium]